MGSQFLTIAMEVDIPFNYEGVETMSSHSKVRTIHHFSFIGAALSNSEYIWVQAT